MIAKMRVSHALHGSQHNGDIFKDLIHTRDTMHHDLAFLESGMEQCDYLLGDDEEQGY